MNNQQKELALTMMEPLRVVDVFEYLGQTDDKTLLRKLTTLEVPLGTQDPDAWVKRKLDSLALLYPDVVGVQVHYRSIPREKCSICHGKGKVDPKLPKRKPYRCGYCEGEGWIVKIGNQL